MTANMAKKAKSAIYRITRVLGTLDQIAEQLQEHCNNEFRQLPKVCLMTTENGLHVREDAN